MYSNQTDVAWRFARVALLITPLLDRWEGKLDAYPVLPPHYYVDGRVNYLSPHYWIDGRVN